MSGPALVRTPVQPADWPKIHEGMRAMWKQCLAEQGGGDVARSLTVNFVGVARAADAEALDGALQRLQRRSPCRAFLVLVDETAAAGRAELAATTRGNGAMRDIVLEEIRVRVPSAAFPQLPGLIRPLLMNDLPTHLFWAAPWPQNAADFHGLAGLCDHVVVDSRRFADPARDLPTLAGLRTGRRITDLAWLRLRPWRRALAEAFERVAWTAGTATHATIRHDGDGKAAALLLGDWLRTRLQANVQTDDSGAASAAGPDHLVVRTGGFEVDLGLFRGQIRAHVSTAEHCYLPFSVPSSRGTDGDLLAAAIDMV
ncbi:MAG: glucose-6-phosphate dehydrogenase assembly protein OpcA [Planctomycetes bacterium]|nr:glucose-6-phosphate dehydrogenase assembly protein OpcA [Planctomycetota bacterium]